MAALEREAKADRIEVRVTPQTKALLAAAAQVRHTSISEFILTNAIAAAEEAVAIPKVFHAGASAWDMIQQMLDGADTGRPSDATVTWLKQM